MKASAAYFVRHEPSSPVRLLLAQAESLVGKSFFEALAAIAPELAGQASIRPGRGLKVNLPLERLAQLLAEPEASDDDEPAGDWESQSDDSTTSSGEDRGSEGDSEGDGEGEEGGSRQASRPDAARPSDDNGTSARTIVARTRKDALVLLENAAAYLRQTEPSSPIPFILDHARSMAGRDFQALLRDVLPANVLSVDEE